MLQFYGGNENAFGLFFFPLYFSWKWWDLKNAMVELKERNLELKFSPICLFLHALVEEASYS